MNPILLCAQQEAFLHPELIGLHGENLDGLDWLLSVSGAEEARTAFAKADCLDEAWLISCDDMDTLNLAAALHRDKPVIPIILSTSELSGSFQSRARAAGVSTVVPLTEITRRFGLEKVRRLQIDSGEEARQPGVSALPALSRQQAFLISVVSGSGGAGKSTFSAIASTLCAQSGLRTLLIDCDLQFGDVDTYVEAVSTLTFEDAVASPQAIDRLLEKAHEGLFLIRSPQESERAEELSTSVGLLLDAAFPYFDVIIANTGSFWNEAQATLIERSARTVFLVNQNMPSVRACQRALGLCARCGIATGSFLFALNHCSKEAPLTAIDLSCALQGAVVEEIAEGGREVEEYLSASMLMSLVREQNECSVSIGALLTKVLPLGNEAIARTSGAGSYKAKSRGPRFSRRPKSRNRMRDAASQNGVENSLSATRELASMSAAAAPGTSYQSSYADCLASAATSKKRGRSRR